MSEPPKKASNLELPSLVKLLVRISVPARDWWNVEECLIDWHAEKIDEVGPDEARKMLYREARWYLIEFVKRIILGPFDWW